MENKVKEVKKLQMDFFEAYISYIQDVIERIYKEYKGRVPLYEQMRIEDYEFMLNIARQFYLLECKEQTKGRKKIREKSYLSKFIEEFEKLSLKEQLELGNKTVDLINKSTNKLQNFDIQKINQSLSECFGTRE